MSTVKVGDTAPAFDLVGDDGARHSLASLRGHKVVLYFYPKDDTPGCTVEAKDFSAALPEFRALGVEVLGVSRDTIERHQNFCQKHGLTLRLLSDTDGSVHRAYGAWGEKKLYGRVSEGCIRSTFLIDEEGVLRAIWSPVRVQGHVQAVLATLRQGAPGDNAPRSASKPSSKTPPLTEPAPSVKKKPAKAPSTKNSAPPNATTKKSGTKQPVVGKGPAKAPAAKGPMAKKSVKTSGKH